MGNMLYYGDNLGVLREHIQDNSIDLIYLDPPFNSKQVYNVLFTSPQGQRDEAQITAFGDSWTWGDEAEKEFTELLRQPNTNVTEMIRAFRGFLGTSDVMAYLVMMAIRLVELQRVLKPTGSIYLHCDPTASHYLKVVMDAIFDGKNFGNEIVWKRTSGHSDAVGYGSVHDIILFYSKSQSRLWNKTYQAYDQDYVDQYYRYKDPDGRMWMSDNLSASGLSGGGYEYDWKGIKRVWRCPVVTMERLENEGRIFYTKNGIPRLKRYLDESKGLPTQDVWTDIEPLRSWHTERLGYPTQKPLALLERIIQASSNAGEVVLDPFCGCGTAVHAAQKLNRQWIGIDITHLAIGLIERRLKDAFPDIEFKVHGTPTDLDGARDLANRDKYEFQYWACNLVNAQPFQNKKKGADSGIDGLIYFQDEKIKSKKIIVSVKGGEHVTRTMVADLKNTVDREGAQMGLFVTLASPTEPMIKEAVTAGYYASPIEKSFPKIQILTIEGLLNGSHKPIYPDLSLGGLSFKKAITEEEASSQPKLF